MLEFIIDYQKENGVVDGTELFSNEFVFEDNYGSVIGFVVTERFSDHKYIVYKISYSEGNDLAHVFFKELSKFDDEIYANDFASDRLQDYLS